MLLPDAALYRKLLRRLTLADLLALYERTVCLYAPLAQAVADEMDSRLGTYSAGVPSHKE